MGFPKGGDLKVSLCKGRFREIFKPEHHDFDGTLVKPIRSLTIEADFWDYGHDMASMAGRKSIDEGSE